MVHVLVTQRLFGQPKQWMTITVSGQAMVSVIHLEQCSAILKHAKLFQWAEQSCHKYLDMVLGLFSKKSSLLTLKLYRVPSVFSMTKQHSVELKSRWSYPSDAGHQSTMRCEYYTSEFFGQAEVATLASAIMSAFRSNNVPLTQLLTLGSDGPNINKTIWREMEQKIREV